MNKKLYITIITLISSLFFIGCTAKVEQIDRTLLSDSEKELLNIQEEIISKIEPLNKELSKQNLSFEKINTKSKELSELIDKKTLEIEKLKEKIDDELLTTETAKIISSTEKITSKVIELTKTIQKQEEEYKKSQDKKIEEQINDNKQLLNGYMLRLESSENNLKKLQLLFTEEGKAKYTEEKTPTSIQTEATI